MTNKKYTAAISCIGSGIGQSIIHSLRLSPLPIKTVGFGNNAFANGAYDCDLHEYVPSIFAPDYAECLLEKCLQNHVDLIIPGMDLDASILSENTDKFNASGVKVLVSDNRLHSMCRDKDLICGELNSISDHFIRCYNKSNFLEGIKKGELSYPCIAKPRNGSGSIGIKILKSDQDFNRIADNYFIQELVCPNRNDSNCENFLDEVKNNRVSQLSEISIQIVTGVNGDLIGRMASHNNLKNGVPIEIIPIEDKAIWDAVDKILPRLLELGMRGPMNIQGRITDEGMKFFEINPRFTGITGLRAMMGFNEVEECVKSWLGIPSAKGTLVLNDKKFGIRQVADKTIPIANEENVRRLYFLLNKKKTNDKKVLLITGSSGYLGRNFINAVHSSGLYTIWALSLDKENTRRLLNGKVDRYFDRDDFRNGNIAFGHVDTLLHFGFARPHCGNDQIADSLFFTSNLFSYAGMHHIPEIINISSQSVYGQGTPPPWKESAPVFPSTSYASAKYATELMLESGKKLNNHINITSLRLASLTGGQSGLQTIDIVAKFVIQALQGEPIEICGQHILERLDVRDAVDGIVKFISIPSRTWKPVYNLGRGQTFSVDKLAEKVIEQVSIVKGKIASRVIKKEGNKNSIFGMDSEAFFQATHWEPKYSLNDTIRSLIEYLDEKK
jgi:nucleoside-diphosphate-sugar epimerase/carbamoylphosphate synthase large subunit